MGYADSHCQRYFRSRYVIAMHQQISEKACVKCGKHSHNSQCHSLAATIPM